jgi:hypothetical protein
MTNVTRTSDWLAKQIASIGDEKGAKFELMGNNLGGKGLPLVAWHLKKKEEYDGMILFFWNKQRVSDRRLSSQSSTLPEL